MKAQALSQSTPAVWVLLPSPEHLGSRKNINLIDLQMQIYSCTKMPKYLENRSVLTKNAVQGSGYHFAFFSLCLPVFSCHVII